MKKALKFSIFVLGFSAMSAQIVFLREFLITFYGNEFSLGLVLSSWLFSGTIGSLLLGKFADRLKKNTQVFLSCQLLTVILLLLAFLGIRLVKPIFNIASGQILPLSVMAISSFIILMPLCIIFSFMFSLGCKLYEAQNEEAAKAVAKIYLLETLGSILAGLLTSFVLMSLLKSIYVISVLMVLNILAVVFLARQLEQKRRQNFYFAGTLFLLVLILSVYFFKGWDKLDSYSLKKQWRGFRVIASQNSIYGNIALAKKDNQIAFFDNGLLLYAVPDKEVAENSAHFALLEHPAPREVLLVGAGLSGLAEEVLKHPVAEVTYVELDPLLIKLAKKYLSETDLKFLKDKRLVVENIDAKAFIKNCNKKYDCVIINLGDPLSAQLNRYYTLDFFKEVKNILKERGLVAFKVTSSENYINIDLKKFLQSLYLTAKDVFEDVKVIPGETAIFLASTQKNMLTYDYHTLEQRAKERNLTLEYVRDYYLFSKLSKQRTDYIEKILKENSSAALNYDFRPSSYFYDTIFWLSYFRDSTFSALLKAVNESSIWIIFFTAIFFIFLFGIISRRNKSTKNIIPLAILVTGFSSLSLQIIILLCFQFIYGYLFYSLGFLLTAFMAGLALGAFFVTKFAAWLKNGIKTFIYTQTAIFVYCLALPLFLKYLNVLNGTMSTRLGADILFPLASMVVGAIGGIQFPLANKIYLKDRAELGKTAGLLYGLDLLGACLGAFLVSIFLVPLIGIIGTCYLLAVLNFSIFLILFLGRRKYV